MNVRKLHESLNELCIQGENLNEISKDKHTVPGELKSERLTF